MAPKLIRMCWVGGSPAYDGAPSPTIMSFIRTTGQSAVTKTPMQGCACAVTV
jgi:hypothetical protein